MQRDKGFVNLLIIIIIALAALKYFLNWDIFDAAATPEGQGTIAYLRQIINTAWSYLAWPLSQLWRIFRALIEWGASITPQGAK